MDCKALSIPKDSYVSGSAFVDSFLSGTVSISMSIGNPRLSLVETLKDCSNAGGASMF